MLVVAHRKSTLDGYNIIAYQQNHCNGSACFWSPPEVAIR